MWNDTDVPLAILFTFRTHGTWLHGDQRGSVDRHNNAYGAARIPKIEHLEAISAARMKHEAGILDARQRNATAVGIKTVCNKRGWGIYAVNVRTNHVHVVASLGSVDPDRALAVLEAYATREMREKGLWVINESPWAEKGSKRRLWNERHISAAVDYVHFGQGRELPKFD